VAKSAENSVSFYNPVDTHFYRTVNYTTTKTIHQFAGVKREIESV